MYLKAFIKNLVQNGSVVTEKIGFEFLYVHDLGPRSRNDLDLQYSHTFIKSFSCLYLPTSWVKVPRKENPEIGRGSWGPPRPPCGSRAKPWWGTRGRSPRKLLDFSNLKPHKTALQLWKFKTKQTKILLI